MKKIIAGATLFTLVLLSFRSAAACTTFCLKNKGEVLFGKNYDWMVGDGMVFVNKRGVAKTATDGSTNPAKWVSKFGSVTFNQYGRENPSGGMNEAGLVIELMWLDDTQYPGADGRPTLGTLEWIQYQLDTSATVAEVIKNADKVRIDSEIKLHYLANDKAGNTATIEFLNGRLIAHSGEKLPVSTLTNDTYERSLNHARTASFDRSRSGRSLDRFVRAAERTARFDKQERAGAEAVNYAFEILSNVAQEGATQWSIVYDQKRGQIYFRTLQSPQIRMIDARSFDYACGSAVKILDMNLKESGDVTARFTDYTRKANRDLIERSFTGTDFLKGVPATEKDQLASYPERFTCSLQEGKPAAAAVTDWSQTALAFAPTLIMFLM